MKVFLLLPDVVTGFTRRAAGCSKHNTATTNSTTATAAATTTTTNCQSTPPETKRLVVAEYKTAEFRDAEGGGVTGDRGHTPAGVDRVRAEEGRIPRPPAAARVLPRQTEEHRALALGAHHDAATATATTTTEVERLAAEHLLGAAADDRCGRTFKPPLHVPSTSPFSWAAL